MQAEQLLVAIAAAPGIDDPRCEERPEPSGAGVALESSHQPCDDPADRRSVRLALTTRGRRRVRAMRRELLAAASELLAPLPDDQRENLAAALEQLRVLLPGRGRVAEGSADAGGDRKP